MQETMWVGALIVALTAVAKKSGLKTKYLPLFAVVIGVGLTFLIDGFSTESVIVGLLTSLTAQGLYSGTRATMKD